MLKIFPEALAQSLNKELLPCYLLVGQDLLLVSESKDLIVQTARQQAFDEKHEINISGETKWDEVFMLAQSNGLFSSRQILIFNLPETLTAAQQKQLTELAQLAHQDLLFIFHLPKFSKTLEKQAWILQLSANAVQISCQTPDINKLPQWISQRAKAMQLSLDNEAIHLVAYSYEGNLLALKQALQLLQLRYPDGKISLNRAKEVVEQSAQFTPFQWVDALLEGKITRAERILQHLALEEVQPVVLLRIVQKELMTLLELSRSPNPIYHSRAPLFSGNLRAEFDRLKVWQNKRGLYQTAIQRLSYYQLYQLFQQLAELERQTKQAFSDQIWFELARFSQHFR